MSVILTSMLLVLGGAILLGEIFAPIYVRWWFKGFSPEQVALCTSMTRVLLPGQLFFFAGGVFGSVMLARKQFALQAVTPLIYNLGIIFGGVVLAKAIGIRSLAWGALGGILIGPFLMNAIGAHRAGVRYRPMLDWSNAGAREWVRLSIPLMLGVSLVTFDSWIMNYFASGDHGAITLLTYAKNLFTAPVALGQAAGAASLPFLASLIGKNDPAAFSRNVNASVSRVLAFSILLTAWMIGLAFPAVDLIFRGGLFHRSSAQEMAVYFAIFSVSLCFWSAQSLYARAFFAASNTLSPMIASTIVVLISLPIYWSAYRVNGATGLAIASDVGIAIQIITLAIMLDRRKMVFLSGLGVQGIGPIGSRCYRRPWGDLSGSARNACVRAVERFLPAAGGDGGVGRDLRSGAESHRLQSAQSTCSSLREKSRAGLDDYGFLILPEDFPHCASDLADGAIAFDGFENRRHEVSSVTGGLGNRINRRLPPSRVAAVP